MNITIEELPLQGLKLVKRKKFSDNRGLFSRIYCNNELSSYGCDTNFIQINIAITNKCGTIRGLHYQTYPYEENKLVTCLRGEIYDVVVDIRNNSETYLQSYSIVLSEKSLNSIFIPKGFAHGFQSLTDDVEILYMHSSPYSPEHECGLRPTDPALGINWPLPISNISIKDSSYLLIS